jgi:spermidine/putrescine-binding protein
MSKRLLALLGLLVLVLAACGDEAGPLDGAAPGDGEAAACEAGETDGDLALYNWSDYMDPDLLDAFADEYGVSVTEDYYPSNEEMLARVQAGGVAYDVIVPSDYMVEIMIEEGLLLELDHDAIPNRVNVADEFADPPFDPGSRYSMPYQWGTTGLGVDLEVVGDDFAPSWALVFDPDVTQAYAGRISLLDDPREAMAAALVWLGYDINTTNEDELAEAADLISETRDRLAAFTSDQYGDLLMAGETAVAHGYSGTFFAAFDEAADPERYEYVIPEEGGVIWEDTMAILASSQSPCTAHAFINFMLDAENGAALTNWTYYASPNAAADEFIIDEIRNDPAIYPDDALLQRLEFLVDTGDFEVRYTDYFSRAKG